MFDFQKTVESGGIVRGQTFVTTYSGTPGTGGFGANGTLIVAHTGGKIYITSGDETYSFEGTLES